MGYDGYAKHHNSESDKAELMDMLPAFRYTFPAFRKLILTGDMAFYGRLGHECPNLSTFHMISFLLLKLRSSDGIPTFSYPFPAFRKTIPLEVGSFQMFGA